jgi:hypothetical protein
MTSQTGSTTLNIKVVLVKPVLCTEVKAVKNISISIKHHQMDKLVDQALLKNIHTKRK